jgi:predicted porin/outer membrane murein-binding lipoprotein Lpp
MTKSHGRLWTAVALSAGFGLLGLGVSAQAQGVSDAQIKALQAQIDKLQATVKQLEAAQAHSNAEAHAAKQEATHAAAQVKAVATAPANLIPSVPVKAEPDGWYFRHKPGSALTFETPGGEITGYGNLDVSFTAGSKNVGQLDLNGATPPVGNFGWMPAVSTNSSYFGLRGFQLIPHQDFTFVYQLEAGFEISATPGTAESNSADHNTVNGALFSRNSFIGVASPIYGALKIGKTTAPYANSTAAFNVMQGSWGDYESIMGNTGGDLRDEFNGRLDHAVWYESPTVHGWQFNLLFAPSQNRSWESTNIAAGEVECTGGDTPQSGGNSPDACNDGAFGNAISTNLSFTSGGFYTTGAFEWHQAVNRQSDITAIYSVPSGGGNGCAANPALTPAQVSACTNFFNQDIADEWAAKWGALYKFETGTTVGGIVEYLHRDDPADLQFQDERTRFGTWLFANQQINPVDSVQVGWAHAFHTPGDPGQHNDATLLTPDGGGAFAPNDNQADMVAAMWKHTLMPGLDWYNVVSVIRNGPSAHYALGAQSSTSVTVDCHDASAVDGDYGPYNGAPGPACFTGTTIVGVETGLRYRF